MAKNLHVVLKDEGWAVVSETNGKSASTFANKREAIDAAREIAKDRGAELVVHGRDGQALRSSDTPTTLSENRIRDAVRNLSHAESSPATLRSLRSPLNGRRSKD